MLSTTAVYLGRRPEIGRYRMLSSGKVRDIYALDREHLLFVTSDRVSAFDVVMGRGVPNKGRVLTAIAAHWFERTRDVVQNHLVSTAVEDLAGLSADERAELRGRVMIVLRAQPTSVEWVVRGYLAGSGWREYQGAQSVCGVPLPSGLAFCGKLPEPILTPTTKKDHHDLPLSPAQARERVGAAVFEGAERAALSLFRRGTEELAKLGILLADTKFEFGTQRGRLLLIDEVLTPDSSRLWPAAGYRAGQDQPSYDKQILRNYLESLADWKKEPPPPALPDDVIERLAAKYLEICTMITGRPAPGVLA
jgi:phosphoribosylaminoimidazole-succinocarboxamide synthase